MSDNNIYQLSNSSEIVHYEKGIIHTQLGLLFNKKIEEELGVNVAASSLTISNGCIKLWIKLRGFSGGELGIISSVTEYDVSNILNPFCKQIWGIFTDSIEECNINPIIDSTDGADLNQKCSLNIIVIDFEKRSRLGFFSDELSYLENAMRAKYPSVDFILRAKNDDRYLYYLVFRNKKEQKRAEKLYGISKMTDHVWELCRSTDEYGIFTSYCPEAIITNIEDVRSTGDIMSIIRDNPNMSSWLDTKN